MDTNWTGLDTWVVSSFTNRSCSVALLSSVFTLQTKLSATSLFRSIDIGVLLSGFPVTQPRRLLPHRPVKSSDHSYPTFKYLKGCEGHQDMSHASFLTVCKALNFGVRLLRRSSHFTFNFTQKVFVRRIQMANNSHDCSLRGGKEDSRGALVVFEGLDRCGKTTQSTKLVKHLESLGYSAELWRYPDRTTSVGQMISSYLSNKSQLDDRTIHLLFSANRWEKRSLMESKLKSGTTILILGWPSHLPKDWRLNGAPEIGLLAPDVVLYLDIPPERAAERGGYGVERYEQLEFQKKVGQRYKELHNANWKIIDACSTMEDVEKQLQEIVLGCVRTCQEGKPLSCLWSC